MPAMINRLLPLFLSLLLAAPVSAGAIRLGPATVPGVRLNFDPVAGRLLREDGSALRRSLVWSDSKAAAFHLSPTTVLKVYAAPTAAAAGEARSQAELNAAGRAETELLTRWAASGLAKPVVETGTTEDGVYYAVLEKPRRGVSGTHLVTRAKYKPVQAKVAQLTGRLAAAGWNLGTFNPAQLYVDRRAQGQAYLIKAYSHDAQQPEAADLPSRYADRLAYFDALESMYRDYRTGAALSDGSATRDPGGIARMALESLRQGKDLRIVYKSGGAAKERVFHVRVLPESLSKDGFVKGYLKVLVFPESGPSKVYTYRLDRIGESAFLAN